MAIDCNGKNGPIIYKLVLTGGPCGGKTTGQARLSTFFENLGWKVFRIPETATVLLSGGVKFAELSDEATYNFQQNLIKTMMQIERTYTDLAKVSTKNCLLICDRGVMDATAYMKAADWESMKKSNSWDEVDLRDRSYQQIIHMVSAAVGAEDFYTCDHSCRSEGIELARNLDTLVAEAWVGHPYYDVVDNSTDFEQKCLRMISAVCQRLGIDFSDRLSVGSKKRKFLIASMPANDKFPSQFQDFEVVHDYLVTPSSKTQARIRRRGQHGNWTYTHTIRRPEINKQSVELKMAIPSRDYNILMAQRDNKHYTIYKRRRCFLWNNVYMQLDEYLKPCPKRCETLVLLETYTLKKGNELLLPDFMEVLREVTDEPKYSMFNLSMKEDFSHLQLFNKNFSDLSVDDPDEAPKKPDKVEPHSPSDLSSEKVTSLCEWLLGEKKRLLEDVLPTDTGLNPNTSLYDAIMSNPVVQLYLCNPKNLHALLSMLDNPENASSWVSDPDAGPMLLQISKIYHAEKSAVAGKTRPILENQVA